MFLEITELGLTQLKILKYKVWYICEPILCFPFNQILMVFHKLKIM